MNEQMLKVLQEIDALKYLPVGWDGDYGKPIPKIVTDWFQCEYSHLYTRWWPKVDMPQPHIVPKSNGSMQLEWRNGDDVVKFYAPPPDQKRCFYAPIPRFTAIISGKIISEGFCQTADDIIFSLKKLYNF